MKKVLILFFLTFLYFGTKSCNAQAYDSLAIEGAHWIITGNDATTLWMDTCYGYKIEGDTFINTLHYKKVYRLYFHADYSSGVPEWNPPLQIENIVLFGAVREENQKVYAIQFVPDYFAFNCTINSEFLFYDLNVQVGDTLCKEGNCNMCIIYTNTSVVEYIVPSSFLPGHKEIQTSDWHFFFEGVGNDKGLFETAFNSVSGGVITGIADYCIGSDANCGLLTYQDEIKNSFNIPVIYGQDNSVKIDLSQITQPVNIEVFSVDGKRVTAFEKVTTPFVEIKMNWFSAGIFFIKITGNQFAVTKKLIN